jgi:hypothetical protein
MGVRVYTDSVTALFDNMVDARMDRLADELKAIIANAVFPMHEAEAPAQSGSTTDSEE